MYLVPFLAVAPTISSMLANRSDDYADFQRLLFAISGLFILISVTFVSIVVNVILNRLDFERRVRWVVGRLIYQLAIVAVKSDTLCSRRIYEKWILTEDKLVCQRKMGEGTPVYWVGWMGNSAEKRIMTFDKQLITAEAYKTLKGREGKEEEKIKKGCW